MSPADSSPCTFDLGWRCTGTMPSAEPCDSANAVATAVEQAVRMSIDMALQPIEALVAEIETTLLDILEAFQSNIEEQVAVSQSSVHDLHCRCGVPPCGAVWAVLVPWQQDSLRTLGLCPADSGTDVVSSLPVQASAEPPPPAVSPAVPGPAPCYFDSLSDRQLMSLLRSFLRALCCMTGSPGSIMPQAPEDVIPVPTMPGGQTPGAGLGESFPVPVTAIEQPAPGDNLLTTLQLQALLPQPEGTEPELTALEQPESVAAAPGQPVPVQLEPVPPAPWSL